MTADETKQEKRDHQTTASLVRERDLDRYWSTVFSQKQKRPGLLALYAFHAELDHILAIVSDPMVGDVRLQWWRDAVAFAAPGVKTGNPLADALSAAIIAYRLPKDRIIGMIDARLPALFNEPPRDDQALMASLSESEGTLFELAATVLGGGSEGAKRAALHAGVAYGLTGMMLKLPFLAARHRDVLPISTIEKHGIDLSAIHRGESSAGLAAALGDMRALANRALHVFRDEQGNLDPAQWPAFLPLSLVEPYLRAMAAKASDPLRMVVALSPLSRFWRIWRAARRRTL